MITTTFKKTTHFFVLALFSLFLVSCVSNKKMVYIEDMDGVIKDAAVTNFEPKVQVNDFLLINVSAVDYEAAIPFNLIDNPGTNYARQLPYLVDVDGNINFPVIGKVKVVGLTIKEVNQTLLLKLKDYLKDPIINIRFENFKVTVLGEVRTPGTYPVKGERITIFEALGLAGDLTIQGKRENVVVIRESDGKRNVIRLDLTRKNIFNSSYYYLAQNDVVYVEPNKTKINSSAVGANSSILISSISTLISLIAILTR